MKITKERLKTIIKEELGSLTAEMLDPETEIALQDVPPTDEEAVKQRIIDELNAEVEGLIASGMDPLTAYGTVLQSPQNQGDIKRSGW